MKYRVPVTVTIETTMVLDTDVDIESAEDELDFAMMDVDALRLGFGLNRDWSVANGERVRGTWWVGHGSRPSLAANHIDVVAS